MSAPMHIAQALQVAFDALSKCAVVDAPAWWLEQPAIPEAMTREEYERDAIASATSSMPDNEPAEDLG